MKIEIADDTRSIIETFTGKDIKHFLEEVKLDFLGSGKLGRNISVKEAAKIMKVSEMFIKIGLENKTLPFGAGINICEGRYMYYISPKLFYEYTGYYPADKIEEDNEGGLAQNSIN